MRTLRIFTTKNERVANRLAVYAINRKSVATICYGNVFAIWRITITLTDEEHLEALQLL